MQKLMKAMHKNEKGFTLVELMVVVVIIGILVAIAIPIFNTVQLNAARKAHDANLRIIDGAIAMWVAETGLNPDAGQTDTVGGGLNVADIATSHLVTGFDRDGSAGNLVLLEDELVIPDRLVADLGSIYSIALGKSEPVGDWGGYRSATVTVTP